MSLSKLNLSFFAALVGLSLVILGLSLYFTSDDRGMQNILKYIIGMCLTGFFILIGSFFSIRI